MNVSLWPLIHPDVVRAADHPRVLWSRHAPLFAVAGLALALPPVHTLVGIDPVWSGSVLALHVAQRALRVHTPVYARWPVAWSTLQLTGTLAAVAALAASGEEPATPVWALFLLCSMVAAMSSRPSLVLLFVIAVAPPAVALAGYSGSMSGREAATAPTMISALSLVAYLTLARMSDERRAIEARNVVLQRAAAAAEERQRIASNLHDSLGAGLAEVATWLDIAALGDPQRVGAVERARRRVDTALEQMRTMVRALDPRLVPPATVARNLEERARALCESHGVEIDFVALTEGRSLPPEVVDQLERFVDEAVNNAVRHGQPHRVAVEVDLGADPAVHVRDDGIGFVAGRQRPGRGLASLAERARVLGGTLEVSSEPGRGTSLRVVRTGEEDMA